MPSHNTERPRADNMESFVGFLLIGLSGGTVAKREKVAACLVNEGRRHLKAHTAPTIGAANRMRQDGSGALAREAALKRILSSLDSRTGGLVVTHVIGADEAALIRKAGGVIWHLDGRISSWVLAHNSEPWIDLEGEGPEHYLDPLDALSEHILRVTARP